jgi:hypothetical protein
MSDQDEQDSTTDESQQSDEAGARQQTEEEGTESDTGKDEPDAAAELEKWKALARKHEGRAKENAAAAKRLAELEDAQKSELQKLQERAEAAEAKALTAARRSAAVDAGLPVGMADRLQGSTDEELIADAKALAEALGTTGKAKDFDTKGGPRGTGSAPTIDAQIAEAQAKGDTATAIRLANSKLFDLANSR